MSRGTLIVGHEVGTLRGWRWHVKNRVLACGLCLRAHALDQGARRNRGRCAKGLGWPL